MQSTIEGISKGRVFSFTQNELKTHLGGSIQGEYLISYLADLGAKTCILEEEYIDHDYMVDYQKYHSRSFAPDGKYTKRLHFFRVDFSEKQLKESLQNNDVEYLQRQEAYLGFVVIRPITDRLGMPLIGRTLLKAYPEKEGNDSRHYLTCKYSISLFGIPLEIDSLPFQAQDEGASACATIALWTVLHPLAERFEITRYSPAEITEISTSTPSISRRFPSGGLTIEQILNGVRSMGLEVEVITTKKRILSH